MLRIQTALLLLCMPLAAFVQEITGIITNQDGQPIPYATIYIEEAQTGTSTNQQGKYELKVTPGQYHIDYRSLGYASVVETVTITNKAVELNVVLPLQSYILAEVTVRADNEDPAYSIMRKAIARAPGFLKQADSYTSQVYIKGSVVATKIPKILAKRMEVNGQTPKEGQTYVNESFNRIRFKAPKTYEQEVISVNNSFPMGDNDVPVIGLISGSIYESSDDFYISPFAPNAFSHYEFKYEGLLQDGAWFIDKIKVTPKRKSKLLMEGFLYIVEDLWCLYSYDVTLNPLYTSLRIKQHYAPVKGNNYFPVGLFVEADISVMGIKAKGTYTTTFKYDSVVINPVFSQKFIKQPIAKQAEPEPEAKPKTKNEVKVEEIDVKLEKLYQTTELTNREMMEVQKLMAKKADLVEETDKENPLEIKETYKQVVNKNALIRDSIYWDSVRPVPASTEEKISYQKVVEEKAKTDSASVLKKTLKIAAFGNYEWERSRKFYVYYPGLFAIRNVGFNPVDSWQLDQSFKLRWKMDSLRTLELKSMLGYSFGRENIYTKHNLAIWYNNLKRGVLVIDGGYLSRDFNTDQGTPENLSALYNLLLKESYIKFYQDAYIDVENRIDIASGLLWRLGAKWQQTDTLSNSTNFSLAYPNDDYDVNVPVNQAISQANLDPSKMFKIYTSFEFTPFYYYQINKGIKRYLKSNWPTFTAAYHAAVPVKSNYANYQMAQLTIHQTLDFYTVASLYYQVSGGLFFNQKSMHFSSFKHFKTIEEPFTISDFKRGFFLINNYEYSTNTKYLEAHAQYSNQFLLLKRLPIISNQMWTENLYLNCLFVERYRPYYEAGYSMADIFFAGEVGVFTAFQGSSFHGVGVKATFKFD
jgi:hypothetical protein